MDPFTFDLHHAIEMIELYGDRVPDLVNVIEHKNADGEIESEEPYRYDTLQCERLLMCPNGTSTLSRGATSVFDCVTGGTQEILRRIVPVADDAMGKGRIELGVSNYTEGRYRRFLSHTPGTRDSAGREFTRTIGHIDLQGFEVATFTLDLRTLTTNMTYGDDYKIGVYAGCTPCPVGYLCEEPGVCSYPPADQMDGIWNADVYPEYSAVCSTCQAEVMPYFFEYQISGLATAKISQIDERGNLRFEGYPDSKHGIVQFNIGALRDTRVMVAVELLNGLYINNFEQELDNKGQFRVSKPDRAIYGSGEPACAEWEPCTAFRRTEGAEGLVTELDGYLKAAQEKCEGWWLLPEAEQTASKYWFLCDKDALAKCPHVNPNPTAIFGTRFNKITGVPDQLTCIGISPRTGGAYPFPYQIMEKPEWTKWQCQKYVGQRCCAKEPSRCMLEKFRVAGAPDEALIYNPQTAYSFLSIINKAPFTKGELVGPYNMPKKDETSVLRTVMIDRVSDWYVGDPSLAHRPEFMGWASGDGNGTSLGNGTNVTASGTGSGSTTARRERRRLQALRRRLATPSPSTGGNSSNETTYFAEEYANMDANVQNTLLFVAKDPRGTAGVKQSFWGDAGVDTIALPYLPFFSNCRGYDSHIYLHKLLEEHPFCANAPNPKSYNDVKKYGANYWDPEKNGFLPGFVTQWPWDHPKNVGADTIERIDQCNHNPVYVETLEGVADLLGYHAQFKDKSGSLKHDRLYNRRLANQGVYKLLKFQAADDISRCNYMVQDFDPLFPDEHPNNGGGITPGYYDAAEDKYLTADPAAGGPAPQEVVYEFREVEAPFPNVVPSKTLGNRIYRMGCADPKWRNPEYPAWCESRDPNICVGKGETAAQRAECCSTYHTRTSLQKTALRKLREVEKMYAMEQRKMAEAQVQIEAGGTFDYKKDATSMSIFADNEGLEATYDAANRAAATNMGMKLSCTYEESVFAPPAVTRWYEAPAGTELFQLTKNPIPFTHGYRVDALRERSEDGVPDPTGKVYDDQPAFAERMVNGGLNKLEWGRDQGFGAIKDDAGRHVPVEIVGNGGSALVVPMTVRLNIGFFMRSDGDYTGQQKFTGTWHKQLVLAEVEFLDYCTITEVASQVENNLNSPRGITPKCNSSYGGAHDYVLEVNFYPMSFFELLNNFQFDIWFYSLMFILVGKSMGPFRTRGGA